MESGPLNFERMMEKCLSLLEHMNTSQQRNLRRFWRDISPKFDALFSQLSEVQTIDLQHKGGSFFDNDSEGVLIVQEHGTDTWQPTCNEETVCHIENESITNINYKVTDETVCKYKLLGNRQNNQKDHSKCKTTKLIKARKNEILDQPRRSNRRVKPSSLYNDFVTTPVTYVKELSQDNNASQLDENEKDEKEDQTCKDSELSRRIAFKTINDFPATSEVNDVSPNETVFQLQLSAAPTSCNTQDGEQSKKQMPSNPDHVYSNVSSQGDLPEQVQILVTVVKNNSEPQVPPVSEEYEEQAPISEEYEEQTPIDEENEEPTPIDEEYDEQTTADAGLGEEGMETGAEETAQIHEPSSLAGRLLIDQKGQSLKSVSAKGKPTQKSQRSLMIIKKNIDGYYDCPDCGKQIANYSNMKVHMRIHSGEKPYSCRTCGKAFSTITNMTRHERTTHNKEKRWQCDQCQKRFTEKKSLVIHKRIHSGERPYDCKVCGQAFAQAGTLKTHLHRHLGIKGHLCDFCGKSFRQKSQLCMHQLRHSNTRNFKCTVCPKAFVSKAELSRHQMSHSGERPFLCSHCPKTFTRLQYLKEHTNFHTNTTPYQCKFCGQAFRDLASHAKHLKRHALDTNVTEPALEGKETYIVLPSSDFFMQEIETMKPPETGVDQVPKLVSGEGGEQGVEAEGAQVALDINQLAMAMQRSAMGGMVEVQEDGATGHTYITDTGEGVNNQVAIQVHSVGEDSQLDPGEQYIIIHPLDVQADGPQAVQQAEDFDNVHVVEVSSEEI